MTGGTPFAAKLQEALPDPSVNFGVLPAFAFANAGVSLSGMTLAEGACRALSRSGSRWACSSASPSASTHSHASAIRSGVGAMPAGASQVQLFGTAILGGIGFTMSLFIGMLSFPGALESAEVRLGVLAGSSMSAVVGYLVLAKIGPRDGADDLGRLEHLK